MAADNLAMAAYLAILMAVPTGTQQGGTASRAVDDASSVNGMERKGSSSSAPSSIGAAAPAPAEDMPTSGSIALSLACAAASSALAQAAAAAWPQLRPVTLTIMALVAMALSSSMRCLLGRGAAGGTTGQESSIPSPFAGELGIIVPFSLLCSHNHGV